MASASMSYKFTMQQSNSFGSFYETIQERQATYQRAFEEENTMSSFTFGQHRLDRYRTPQKDTKQLKLVNFGKKAPEEEKKNYIHVDRMGIRRPHKKIEKQPTLKKTSTSQKEHTEPKQSKLKEAVLSGQLNYLGLSVAHRLSLFEWLSREICYFQFTNLTFHLTVTLFEQVKGVTLKNAQAILAVCLMIVAKLEQKNYHGRSFLERNRDIGLMDQLAELELLVLISVNFKIRQPCIFDMQSEVLSKWDEYIMEIGLPPPKTAQQMLLSSNTMKSRQIRLELSLLIDRLLVTGLLSFESSRRVNNYYMYIVAAGIFIIYSLEMGQLTYDRLSLLVKRKHNNTSQLMSFFIGVKLRLDAYVFYEVLGQVAQEAPVMRLMLQEYQRMEELGKWEQYEHRHVKGLYLRNFD